MGCGGGGALHCFDDGGRQACWRHVEWGGGGGDGEGRNGRCGSVEDESVCAQLQESDKISYVLIPNAGHDEVCESREWLQAVPEFVERGVLRSSH